MPVREERLDARRDRLVSNPLESRKCGDHDTRLRIVEGSEQGLHRGRGIGVPELLCRGGAHGRVGVLERDLAETFDS